MSSTTSSAAAASSTSEDPGGEAQNSAGISAVAFVTALTVSLIIFGVQIGLFLLLRNKLARILYVLRPSQPNGWCIRNR